MDTLTAAPTEDAVQSAAAPYLFVVLQGANPLAGGTRVRLDAFDRIVLGRGDVLVLQLDEPRVATLRIPDRRMSSRHAVLSRGLSGWTLADADSKNGTRVDGSPAVGDRIRDAAVIEVGQTALILRNALDGTDGAVVSDGTTELGVRTLVPALAATYARLAQLAPSRVPIVLGGETGTGKEVIARAIHAASGRAGAFVAINCGALPAGLVESALFGHRRGAFTDALSDQLGAFRAADGGTLLLDELGDLPFPSQAALLRVLQEHEVVPVGDTAPIPIDVRVIGASHRDLDALITGGSLRADLFARLSGHRVTLPPLRARREDIGLAVAMALQRHRAPRDFTIAIDAVARLVTARWALNLRELDHAIATALAMVGDGPLTAAHLPTQPEPAPGSTPDELRTELIRLLELHHGNVSAIARELGKARMQIQRWLRRFDLDPGSFRP